MLYGWSNIISFEQDEELRAWARYWWHMFLIQVHPASLPTNQEAISLRTLHLFLCRAGIPCGMGVPRSWSVSAWVKCGTQQPGGEQGVGSEQGRGYWRFAPWGPW